jgi:hypothetical protein
MTTQAILLPLFLEVILTFGLLFWMGPLRAHDLGAGGVRAEDIALREPNWSKRSMQVANAFSNQFEMPVLFYVLTILEYVTHLAGILFVVLAWVYVLFRYLHAYVHVTSNIVRLRGALFGISTLVLAVMWVIYIVEVLAVPAPL